MKFELNTDKSPFCTIGQYSFSFAQTSHDIDISSLSDILKTQLKYNLQRQVLTCDDSFAIPELSTSPVLAPPPVVQKEVAKLVKVPAINPIEEDNKSMRALLRETVFTIKKEADTYSIGKLRRLLDLEKETKNRKAVLNFIQARLDRHEQSVTAKFADVDSKPINGLDPHNRSTQITDVVESDIVELVLPQDALD